MPDSPHTDLWLVVVDPMFGGIVPPALTGVQRGGVHFVMGGFGHPGSSPFFFHHHHRFFGAWPYGAFLWISVLRLSWVLRKRFVFCGFLSGLSSLGLFGWLSRVAGSRRRLIASRMKSSVCVRSGRRGQSARRAPRKADAKTELQPTELIFRDKHTEAGSELRHRRTDILDSGRRAAGQEDSSCPAGHPCHQEGERRSRCGFSTARLIPDSQFAGSTVETSPAAQGPSPRHSKERRRRGICRSASEIPRKQQIPRFARDDKMRNFRGEATICG